MDNHKMYKILHEAQETYGYSNQCAVAAEECCELAIVLNKYVRYPDHTTASEKLRHKIVEEIGDVVICLNHLYMMFNITEEEITEAMDGKLERLQRWLRDSKDLYQSTIDREVKIQKYSCGLATCENLDGITSCSECDLNKEVC